MDLDIGVIVDIAVEDGDHVWSAAGLLELFAVERMTVGLADDSDTGPARVTEHGEPCIRLRK